MERRITEEQLTKTILNWLESNCWEIICYDFPQSGTGYSLHPNEELRTTKNKGAIIPDIVAIKNGVVIFFENKDRFVQSDFDKVYNLINTHNYTNSVDKLLKGYIYKSIYYGIAIPYNEKEIPKINTQLSKVNFLIQISETRTVKVLYQEWEIFKILK